MKTGLHTLEFTEDRSHGTLGVINLTFSDKSFIYTTVAELSQAELSYMSPYSSCYENLDTLTNVSLSLRNVKWDKTPKPPKPMTVDDIEKALGYKIQIVSKENTVPDNK